MSQLPNCIKYSLILFWQCTVWLVRKWQFKEELYVDNCTVVSFNICLENKLKFLFNYTLEQWFTIVYRKNPTGVPWNIQRSILKIKHFKNRKVGFAPGFSANVYTENKFWDRTSPKIYVFNCRTWSTTSKLFWNTKMK